MKIYAFSILVIISCWLDSSSADVTSLNCEWEGYDTSKIYALVRIPLHQHQGVEECLRRGLEPAVIYNPEENRCLGRLLDISGVGDDYVYTAGIYSPFRRNYVWRIFNRPYDTEDIIFSNWEYDQPTYPGCLAVGPRYNHVGPEWRSIPCDHHHYIACQVPRD